MSARVGLADETVQIESFVAFASRQLKCQTIAVSLGLGTTETGPAGVSQRAPPPGPACSLPGGPVRCGPGAPRYIGHRISKRLFVRSCAHTALKHTSSWSFNFAAGLLPPEACAFGSAEMESFVLNANLS